jgi:hypothetical protein
LINNSHNDSYQFGKSGNFYSGIGIRLAMDL